MMASRDKRHPLKRMGDNAAARMKEAGADAVVILWTYHDAEKGTINGTTLNGNRNTIERMVQIAAPVICPDTFGLDDDEDEDPPQMPDNGDESDSGDENSA